MQNQIKIGVHAIVKNKKGEILLCRRNKKLGYGEWELPGGHLEFQESLEKCIERECQEELGIKISIGNFVSVSPNVKYGNHYIILSFEVDSYSGEPSLKAPEEHSEIKWFDIKSLPEPIFVSTKHTLDNYFSGNIYRTKWS